ncbi:MAG TPA: radical SAM protein [Pyrinomonadaceae bacterium]|nr:radical SAM protein [Pyrinomonadaceae bacterium]
MVHTDAFLRVRRRKKLISNGGLTAHRKRKARLAMGKPFILKYRYADKYYIYDVNSNCVLEVDKALFTVINHVEITGDSPVPVAGEKLQGVARVASLSDESVNKALGTISDAYANKGLFSDRRPTAMRYPFTKEDLRIIVSSTLCRLILGITESCNLRCTYCKYSGSYQYARQHSNTQMTEATAHKAVRFLMDHSGYIINETNEPISITFYGGEPFINFRLIKSCVSFVEEHYPERRERVLFALTSNFTMPRQEILEFLAKNQIDLTVSVDGPQILHDRYRVSARGKGSFERLKRNLERLRKIDEKYYDEKVAFSIVITPPYDLETVVDFFEHDDLVGGHLLFVSYADRSYTTFYDRFDMNTERKALFGQLDRLRTRFDEGVKSGSLPPRSPLTAFTSGALRYVVQRPVGRLGSVIFPNGVCVPGAHRTFVTPDGKLYMCERIGETVPIGDLESGYDMDSIDQALQRYIAISEDDCRNCWAVRFCGACFIAGLKGSEFCGVSKQKFCSAQRQDMLVALKQYSELVAANAKALNNVFPPAEVMSTLDLAKGCLAHHKQVATAAGTVAA